MVLVPFPFTDQSAVKQRPAVVLSSHTYNAAHLDLILAPITGRLTGSTDDVVLADWQAAGLVKPSAVKPLLASFTTTLIRRELGQLTPADLSAVRLLFSRILLDLSSPRARNVTFSDDALTVELADNRRVSVPLTWFPRLEAATPAQRDNWRLAAGGIGVRWEEVEEEIAVMTLLRA